MYGPLLFLGFLAETLGNSPRSQERRKGPPLFLRIFNSLQIVAFFAGMPYLISYLGAFAYTAGYYTAIVAYVFLYGFLVAAVTRALRSWNN